MKKFFVLAVTLSGIFAFGQDEKQDSTDYNPIEIKEVLVQSQRKKMFADKAVYTFDKEALEKARYAKDLLNTLPELQVDPISNTIQSTKGGKTLLLINGTEATDNQIRAVKPQDVVRVEYFDIPPARYANRADQVVNLITRNPENGYVYGADISSALSTGFVNGSAYANFTKGKNNFGLEYYIYFRDYKDRTSMNIYDYNLNNIHYRTENQRNEYFGYTDQTIALRYTNSDSDKYAFQAKLDMNISSSFAYANGTSLFYQNSLLNNHSTYKHSNSNYSKPTLDLYYSRKLGKKDELSLNVVGSMYTTKSIDETREWETVLGTEQYNYLTNLEADQKGIVGEIAHTHSFEKGKLNSGYRISNNSIDNKLENLNGPSNNKVNYLEQYIYSEYSGKVKKLSYRLGVGLTNVHNKNEDTNTDTWTFTPKLVLGYELAKNQNLRFSSSYKPTSPWNSALSKNVIQVVENITQEGNPYLTIQKSFGNNLIYSFNSKYFDLNTNAFYHFTKDPINQLYLQNIINGNVEGYKLTYENAQNSQRYGVQITGSIKPFGTDILTVKVNVAPATERFKTKDGRILKNDYIGNYFALSSVYKNFRVDYQFNIPYYTLGGALLYTQENMNHAFASYKYNNWTFSTGMYWIGMPSTYKQKTMDKQYVDYSRVGKIWDNKSMFVVGLSFDFATGKKTNINRKLENKTAGAATF
ncbi:outer membrane beta-barrel protein [Empedobacter tilapiae]|uniref:TonB-dependent receptor n=1 Tax=Empedobacter tilapiae TaxID=2491114 RepID=A0A4Z1BX28_9FLAO|nr:outer membrane beta-barrel protein [Empedobacter tilapiae]TGN27065.1 TonB-dependent receptor [Empedobacter tilapiae]